MFARRMQQVCSEGLLIKNKLEGVIHSHQILSQIEITYSRAFYFGYDGGRRCDRAHKYPGPFPAPT